MGVLLIDLKSSVARRACKCSARKGRRATAVSIRMLPRSPPSVPEGTEIWHLRDRPVGP